MSTKREGNVEQKCTMRGRNRAGSGSAHSVPVHDQVIPNSQMRKEYRVPKNTLRDLTAEPKWDNLEDLQDESGEEYPETNYRQLERKLQKGKTQKGHCKGRKEATDGGWSEEEVIKFLEVLSQQPQGRKSRGCWKVVSEMLARKYGIQKSNVQCSKQVKEKCYSHVVMQSQRLHITYRFCIL